MALIQTCQIRAIMTVPQRLSFLCRADPPHKHNRFQYTVPSHIKSCTAHSGGGGVRGKKPGFLERKAYGKESPNSISTHDCGMVLTYVDILCQYQIS